MSKKLIVVGLAADRKSSHVLLTSPSGECLSKQVLVDSSLSRPFSVNRIIQIGDSSDVLLIAAEGIITLARVSGVRLIVLRPSIEPFADETDPTILAVEQLYDNGQIFVCGMKRVLPLALKFN